MTFLLWHARNHKERPAAVGADSQGALCISACLAERTWSGAAGLEMLELFDEHGTGAKDCLI